jgi:hypothetical protein
MIYFPYFFPSNFILRVLNLLDELLDEFFFQKSTAVPIESVQDGSRDSGGYSNFNGGSVGDTVVTPW